jgi:hypothetical protein
LISQWEMDVTVALYAARMNAWMMWMMWML